MTSNSVPTAPAGTKTQPELPAFFTQTLFDLAAEPDAPPNFAAPAAPMTTSRRTPLPATGAKGGPRGSLTSAASASAGDAPVPYGERYPLLATGVTGVALFIQKSYEMVCHEDAMAPADRPGYIQWTEEGTSFLISEPKDLETHCLPKFFKHSNFQSFVRQLNMYGFHKVGSSQKCEFFHEEFLRGRVLKLRDIKRKKAVGSTVLAADGETKLSKGALDDIVLLKRQRDVLLEEVTELKMGQESVAEQLAGVREDNEQLRLALAESRQQQATLQKTVTGILEVLKRKFPAAASCEADPADEPEPPAKRRRPPPVDIPPRGSAPVEISVGGLSSSFFTKPGWGSGSFSKPGFGPKAPSLFDAIDGDMDMYLESHHTGGIVPNLDRVLQPSPPIGDYVPTAGDVTPTSATLREISSFLHNC